ncbi:Hypothetical predicted protein [Podarcis lilfordi]|uniref:Uncharacterized protein n=1 Tax=Podarcis lilfordi TaxID=74358 RepID=A0AA35KLL8_9SAUR|nr:Hypothetical predicted protein [Podarcis lilfordi]
MVRQQIARQEESGKRGVFSGKEGRKSPSEAESRRVASAASGHQGQLRPAKSTSAEPVADAGGEQTENETLSSPVGRRARRPSMTPPTFRFSFPPLASSHRAAASGNKSAPG